MIRATPRRCRQLRLERKLYRAAISALADGARFAPPPLSEAEQPWLDAAEPRRRLPWVVDPTLDLGENLNELPRRRRQLADRTFGFLQPSRSFDVGTTRNAAGGH